MPSGQGFKEKLFPNADCDKDISTILELKVDGADIYIMYCIFTVIVTI